MGMGIIAHCATPAIFKLFSQRAYQKKTFVFCHVTRRHRRVAPFNQSRGQMASSFYDFLDKHTDGQAHPHQVSKTAAPKRARQASFLACIDAKTQNTRHFNLTQPDLKSWKTQDPGSV
jgi:hypothetical protein